MAETLLILLLALLLDRVFGEPKRWHPLVGLGQLADLVEENFNETGHDHYWRGTFAVALIVLPLLWLATALEAMGGLGFVFSVAGLYLCIGWRSLGEHLQPIQQALQSGQLQEARMLTQKIVSRDSESLDEEGIAKAAVESALENGNDAIFSAIFWFVLLGLPGVIVYRVVNTLDAMWGYKTERFFYFGWAAARLDDVLNYVPARLTALSYMLMGNWGSGWRAWQQQADQCESPNAGVVMAAGAGALHVRVGGDTRYHGELKHKPELGFGDAPGAGAIGRALELVNRSVFLWLAVVALLAWLVE